MFGKAGLEARKGLEGKIATRFNPRVRGTCLVRPHAALALAGVHLRGFNPRVRGTCLVRGFLYFPNHATPSGVAFQSPCAGNMFGKDLTGEAIGAKPMFGPMLFQSPCAGNMFGKYSRLTCGSLLWKPFQSPCAGNMFGKVPLHAVEPARVSGPLRLFQSPCAGNMFGKAEPPLDLEQLRPRRVSIPVCGEHVW